MSTFYELYHLQITCKTTGKIYIGKHQTKNLQDGYMGSGKLLINAQKKYGLENFSKEILHVFETEEEMNQKEAELVTEEFCLREDTYNLCPGGKGGWGYLNSNGLNKSEKQKISAANTLRNFNKNLSKQEFSRRGRIAALARALKVSNGELQPTFLGKTHTEEWKKNHSSFMKEFSKGNNNSQFGTMWITNGTENKKIKKTDSIPEGFRKGRKINNKVE